MKFIINHVVLPITLAIVLMTGALVLSLIMMFAGVKSQ